MCRCSRDQNANVVICTGWQCNGAGQRVLHYAPPVIVGDLVPGQSDSIGGVVVLFNGLNFGPPTSQLTVSFLRGVLSPYLCRVVVRVRAHPSPR